MFDMIFYIRRPEVLLRIKMNERGIIEHIGRYSPQFSRLDALSSSRNVIRCRAVLHAIRTCTFVGRYESDWRIRFKMH